jgi:hypothetical protein
VAASDLPINRRDVSKETSVKKHQKENSDEANEETSDPRLGLVLANFATQAMAQSTPQQVKGINAQGESGRHLLTKVR